MASPALLQEEEEKQWEVCTANPEDFDAWSKLIKYSEELNDIEKIRRALKGILGTYPYCYGYWKRWASHEKRCGNLEEADKVLEEGVASVPRSDRLWSYYCKVKQEQEVDVSTVRALFLRAAACVGNDSRSTLFWEEFLAYEEELLKKEEGDTKDKDNTEVFKVYISIFSNPIEALEKFFTTFKEKYMSSSPSLLTQLKSAWEQVHPELTPSPTITKTSEKDSGVKVESETKDTPTSTDETMTDAPSSSSDAAESKTPEATEATEKVDEWSSLMLKIQRVYASSLSLKNQMNPYVQQISRPYFHVKPLSDEELGTWQTFLNFAIEYEKTYNAQSLELEIDIKDIKKEDNGEEEDKIIQPKMRMAKLDVAALFDRCLVCTALYPQFWQLYGAYLKETSGSDATRTVLVKATTQFCKSNPVAHINLAEFEEELPNTDNTVCVSSYNSARSLVPNSIPLLTARINYYRRIVARAGAGVQSLFDVYEDTLESLKDCEEGKDAFAYISMHYARYLTTIPNLSASILGNPPQYVVLARKLYEDALRLFTSTPAATPVKAEGEGEGAVLNGDATKMEDETATSTTTTTTKSKSRVLAVLWQAYIDMELGCWNGAKASDLPIKMLYERALSDTMKALLFDEGYKSILEQYVVFFEDYGFDLKSTRIARERLERHERDCASTLKAEKPTDESAGSSSSATALAGKRKLEEEAANQNPAKVAKTETTATNTADMTSPSAPPAQAPTAAYPGYAAYGTDGGAAAMQAQQMQMAQMQQYYAAAAAAGYGQAGYGAGYGWPSQ